MPWRVPAAHAIAPQPLFLVCSKVTVTYVRSSEQPPSPEEAEYWWTFEFDRRFFTFEVTAAEAALAKARFLRLRPKNAPLVSFKVQVGMEGAARHRLPARPKSASPVKLKALQKGIAMGWRQLHTCTCTCACTPSLCQVIPWC
jgi:hypothetical protein